jgi:predicted DsbA family dithiol-disulfide isomerase
VDSRLERLLDLLDDERNDETIGTSVRLPVNLREAAGVAAELGLTGSTTELTVRALRDILEAFAQQAVLDAHYAEHPEVRPTLAETALAAAELDGNPLARRPDLVRRAASEVGAVKDDPDADDVLLFAAGLAAATAAA